MSTIASPASGPLPFSSNVVELPLPVALERLFVARSTGLLTLESRQGRHVVYLRDGYPVSVELPGSVELLGRVLVEMKFLDEKTLQGTLAAAPPAGTLYGELLLEKGLITEDQLRQGLKAQVRRKLHRLFFLTEATISYVAGEHQEGVQRSESLRVHPWRATYHGVRSAWNADRLRQALTPLAGRRLRTALTVEELARFGLGPEDGKVAGLLREQPHTVESLAAASGLPIQPVSALCYALYVASALSDSETQPHAPRSGTASTKPGFDASAATARAAIAPATTAAPVAAAPVAAAPVAAAPVAAAPVAAAPVAAAPLSPAAIELERLVQERLPTIDTDDFFQVLGVPRTATAAQIKTAYLEAARRFHPDRLGGLGLTRLHGSVEKIFRRVSAAQTTLLDDQRRAKYMAELANPPSAEDSAAHQQAMSLLQAEISFHRGQGLLKKNELASALREFEAALAVNPKEGEHVVYVAWTRRCLGQISLSDAKNEIARGLKLSPRCASGHYFLGMLLKEEDAVSSAILAFRKAVTLDERMQEAEQEIRVLEIRRSRENQKPSFFDRFRKSGK